MSHAVLETKHPPGANSTGVYSGALAVVNGNGGMSDRPNLNKAFLRGIQQTDSEGVVQFDTNFPGHYVGRTTHLHIITHVEDTKAKENNTIWNSQVRHIGQAFFDQTLINAIEATAPYSTNRQARTANKNDAILIQQKIKRYTAPLNVPVETAPVKDSTITAIDTLKQVVKPE